MTIKNRCNRPMAHVSTIPVNMVALQNFNPSLSNIIKRTIEIFIIKMDAEVFFYSWLFDATSRCCPKFFSWMLYKFTRDFICIRFDNRFPINHIILKQINLVFEIVGSALHIGTTQKQTFCPTL